METMLYSLKSTKDLGLKTVWEHKEDKFPPMQTHQQSIMLIVVQKFF